MEKASDILKKMEGQGREFTISKQTVNRAESVEMVRTAREQGKQQLVYSSRPFVLCGLPVKRPKKGVLKHLRRNGKFFLRVTGDVDLGSPFGQDRLIPIWVATLAIKQKDRYITFKSAAEILETFGLPKDGPHYRRLVDGFKRIFGATIFFGTEEQLKGGAMFDWTRFHFFDRMKIWYTKHLDQQQLPSEDFQNQILLSENFWNELQRHPIPIDLEAVKALANAPAQTRLLYMAGRAMLVSERGDGHSVDGRRRIDGSARNFRQDRPPRLPHSGTEMAGQDQGPLARLGIPFHRDFDEVNLRFYVRRREGETVRRGVVFIREIVPRYAIAHIARLVYNENYVCLPMAHRIEERMAEYRWRLGTNWNCLQVDAAGEGAVPADGSGEQFITEHYWGYSAQRDGGTVEYQVEHQPWRVWRAGRSVFEGDVASLYGTELSRVLTRPPDSALLADGSAVTVYAGKRIRVGA